MSSFTFGSPTPAGGANTSGFSFGGSTTTPAAPSFSGFGTSTAAPTTAAPSFGGFATSAAPSTTTTAPTLGAPTSGFGGFGTSTTTPAAAPTTTGFSFGTNNAAPSTSTFGTNTTTTAANPLASFSGFGAPTTTPAAPTTSTFGSLPSTTTTAPATTSTFGTGLGGVSGFGGFGTTFGNSTTPSLTSSSSTAPSVFGTSTTFGQPQSLQQQQPQLPKFPPGPVIDALEKLQRSYAPVRDNTGKYVASGEGVRNDECNFKTIMLNKRSGSASQQDQLVYGELLEQAERDNTDPENYIPVEELGIVALKSRYDKQKEESTKIREQAIKISDLLKAVREANQQLNSRYELLKRKQLNITKRVLAIVRKIEVLRCHGTPLQQSELIYRDRLLQMLQAAELPMKKLQEMSVNLALQEVPQDMYTDDINEEDLANLVAALKKQSEGIENLSEMLRKDVRDITIVRNNISSKR